MQQITSSRKAKKMAKMLTHQHTQSTKKSKMLHKHKTKKILLAENEAVAYRRREERTSLLQDSEGAQK